MASGQVIPIGAPWDRDRTVKIDMGEYRRRLEEIMRYDAIALMDRHPRLVRSFDLALLVICRRAGLDA